MPFGADLDAWEGNQAGPLALIEKKSSRYMVSWGEAKLLLIAGAGFLMDAYDLFIINMIYAIILVVYFPGKKNIDWGLDGGVLKAAANIGCVFGQVLFGVLGDTFGRSAVYGKELLIVIFGVIMIISAPDSIGGHGITIWMTVFRFIFSIGIGGDYPMSATIVADRANMHKRGFLLAWIFSNQGWGNFTGGALAVIVVRGYKHWVVAGQVHKLSGAWRILQGLALVPAFAVLYFRLTLVESTRFTQARKIQDDPEILHRKGIIAAGVESDDDIVKEKEAGLEQSPSNTLENRAIGLKFDTIGEKPHNDFIEYFSEWRHLKTLIGTASTWFLVDITFYGINLNQSSILASIGFTTGTTYEKLYKTALGNLIITCAGFLPGYFFTMFTIEPFGRKPVQMGGFIANALFLGILAGTFNTLKTKTGPFFVVFTLLQLSFNWGANATTFIVPAEVFPTRVRASAVGVSAACGKVGAIISALGFSILADPKHLAQTGVFWIFFGVSILGAIMTYFFVPETKGYDADLVDRQELAEKAETKARLAAGSS